jgi:hypothetical protein
VGATQLKNFNFTPWLRLRKMIMYYK